MKKRSNLILFLLCAVIFIFCGCSTYRVIKDATDHEEGRLIMGRVKMPNGKTKKLRMRTTDGRKVKVQNTEVGVLGVWKKTHPETVSFLVCHPYYTIAPFSTKKKKR
mgnify:CR=1 FL=1